MVTTAVKPKIKLINAQDLMIKLIQVIQEKDNIILYSQSGKRSHQVAEKLIDWGITPVSELKGSIMAWQD